MNRKDVKLHQVIGKGEFGGKWFTVRTAASHCYMKQDKTKTKTASLLKVVNENSVTIKYSFLSDDCRCDGGGLQRDQSGRKVH